MDANLSNRCASPEPRIPDARGAGRPIGLTRAILNGPNRPADALSWEAISAAGRVVVTPDGRPIRSIITGRKRIVTGSYPSRKAGRTFPHESMNEHAFFMHSEVDTRVVDYRAQPFRFEFVGDGAKLIYIADCVRLLEGNQVEVVEVKNDGRALRDDNYVLKLNYVKAACEKLGWAFRIVFRDDLVLPTATYVNVQEVQSRRLVRFDASHGYTAVEVIQRAGGAVPLGRLAEALGDRRRGSAIAKAMMVCRLIDIDLSRPLSCDSPVRLVEQGASHRSDGGAS